MNKPTRLLPSKEKPILVMVIEAKDASLNRQDYPDAPSERDLLRHERHLQHQRH